MTNKNTEQVTMSLATQSKLEKKLISRQQREMLINEKISRLEEKRLQENKTIKEHFDSKIDSINKSDIDNEIKEAKVNKLTNNLAKKIDKVNSSIDRKIGKIDGTGRSKVSMIFSPLFSTFWLFNSYFVKTIYGPIIAFVFPTLLLAIVGNILRIEYVFPGIVAMTSMFIAVQAMPLGLMEMKNSTLFKYIGSSPMSSKQFSLVIIFYYIFIDFVAILIVILMAAALFHTKVFHNGHLTDPGSLFSGILTPFGAFSFLSANLLHMALGLAIGITIATLSKTPQQALTIGLIIVIPSMFLSGMVITVDIIAQSDAMQWISRFVPFRYTTGNIIIASTPSNQIGDFFQVLSYGEKAQLFRPIYDKTGQLLPTAMAAKYVDANGVTQFLKTGSKQEYIGLDLDGNLRVVTATEPGNPAHIEKLNDIQSILATFNAYPKDFKQYIQDPQLFDMVLVDGHADSMAGSDNNIFNFLNAFGVRKTPDVDKIQAFLVEYLGRTISQSPDATGKMQIQIDQNALKPLADSIAKKNFEWVNLFTRQTMKMYTSIERIMNIFLPLVVSTIFMLISYKKFKWTSR